MQVSLSSSLSSGMLRGRYVAVSGVGEEEAEDYNEQQQQQPYALCGTQVRRQR